MAISLFFALLGISALIMLGFFPELLFEKTHVPDVLVLFVAGILIGPAFGVIAPDQFANIEPIFVSLAIILIIFEGGFNISIKDFLKEVFSGTMLSLIFFSVSAVMITVIMVYFDYHILAAVLLGTTLAGTSSIVVIPFLKMVNISGKASLVLTLESTFSDVLCIISTLAVIDFIGFRALAVSDILKTLFLKFVVAIVLGAAAGFAWFFIKNRFHEFDRAYMITIGYTIMVYVFVEQMSSNGVVAILTLAIVLANAKQIFGGMISKDLEYKVTSSERIFYTEISFFIKTFFFVYLGLLIDFSNPILFVYGAVIAIFLSLVRPYIVRLVSHHAKELHEHDRMVMGAMAPKGIATAILAQYSISSSALMTVPGVKDIPTIALSVILFSIILTSMLVFYVEKKYDADPKKL